MMTHPKQTFGMLELVPDPTTTEHTRRGERDPRWRPDFSTRRWRDEHPLGIERSSHLTVLVENVPPALDFYQAVLGGKLLHQQEGSAFVALGNEIVVELASPSSPRLQRDLVRYGEGLHSVTFKVKDLAKAVDYLTSKGMRFESREDDTVVINRGGFVRLDLCIHGPAHLQRPPPVADDGPPSSVERASLPLEMEGSEPEGRNGRACNSVLGTGRKIRVLPTFPIYGNLVRCRSAIEGRIAETRRTMATFTAYLNRLLRRCEGQTMAEYVIL